MNRTLPPQPRSPRGPAPPGAALTPAPPAPGGAGAFFPLTAYARRRLLRRLARTLRP